MAFGKQGLSRLWIGGILVFAALASFWMNPGPALIFCVWLVLAFRGRELWSPLGRIELLLLGLLAVATGASILSGPVGSACIKILYAIFLGFFLVWISVNLLTGRWKRPVGRIMDACVIVLCLLLPMFQWLLSWHVGEHFDSYPVVYHTGGLPITMAVLLAVYLVMSQLFTDHAVGTWQGRGFATWALAAVGAVLILQLADLGLDLLPEKEIGIGKLAREARRDYEQGEVIRAVATLQPAARLLHNDDRGRKRLLEFLPLENLVTLTLGSRRNPPTDAEFGCLALDRQLGLFYLLDTEDRLWVLAPDGFEEAGEIPSSPGGAATDMLWWAEAQRLVVLYPRGTLLVSPARPMDASRSDVSFLQGKWVAFESNYGSPARRLAVAPDGDRIVIGHGDFCLKAVCRRSPQGLLEHSEVLFPQAPLHKGKDLLRGICFPWNAESAYLLDAYGGIHPLGRTPIDYADLHEHRHENYHYWSPEDRALTIDCSADGRQLMYFDVFGGIHCVEKVNPNGKIDYFGSSKGYYEEAEAVDVAMGYDSCYLLKRDGRIDRREGRKKIFALRQSARSRADSAFLISMAFVAVFGAVLLLARRME